MKETWQTRWQQLAPRERRMISWGGSGLLAALLYAYLWQPVAMERDKLRTSLPQMKDHAAQMRFQAEEAAQLKTSIRPGPKGEAIKSAIYRTAGEIGMDNKALQLNMLDEHHASISMTKVSFTTWMTLVTDLQKNQGIRLESCDIEALPETGMIHLRATLAARG